MSFQEQCLRPPRCSNITLLNPATLDTNSLFVRVHDKNLQDHFFCNGITLGINVSFIEHKTQHFIQKLCFLKLESLICKQALSLYVFHLADLAVYFDMSYLPDDLECHPHCYILC